MKPLDFVRVKFTPAEWEVVSRDINGKRWGTFQRCLAGILQKTNRRTLSAELTPQEVIDVQQMANYRTPGGYQDRYKVLAAAIERAKVQTQ